MATMTVSLPDPMKDWIEAQISRGEYASASDYVRDLIRRDLVPEVWVPSLEERATRERLRRRSHLIGLRTSAINRSGC